MRKQKSAIINKFFYAGGRTWRCISMFALILTISVSGMAQLRGERVETKDTSPVISLAETKEPAKGDADEKFSSAVGPIFVSGNPTCKDLRWSGNPNFSHMTEDWEMKIDLSTPNGVFYMVQGGGVVLDGGLVPNPSLYLSVVSSGSTLSSWSLGPLNLLDRAVSAVIVKGGPSANVYAYPFLSVGDTGPFVTPQNFQISHITFCFEPFSGPSSAEAKIMGRSITTGGVGISGARIEVMNLSTGEITRAITNTFGYYTVENLKTAEMYLVTISHKRHQFFENQRVLTLDDDLNGLDFVAAW